MSFGSRIKERREQLGMSRTELAEEIGVVASAVGNYENDYSTPKIELLYKIFDALQCDANYLYQDEMRETRTKTKVLADDEMELIECYRDLCVENKTKLVRVAHYLAESEELEGLIANATDPHKARGETA